MLGRITTATLHGADAHPIWVETHVGLGLPAFITVGLPDSAVKESRVRIEAALKSSGFALPSRRVLLNLAPADVRKEGSGLDLPMALSVLSSYGAVAEETLADKLVVGELGLDGSVRRVPGAIVYAVLARKLGLNAIIVPPDNAAEASLVPGVRVLTCGHLFALVEALSGRQPFSAAPRASPPSDERVPGCFSEVGGLKAAKRALEVAAVGGHHVLICGPPGHGKTMLAERFVGLLPALEEERQLEVMAIHSLLRGATHMRRRPPLRAPHHTLSTAALIGGGSSPRPGEVSLAHGGVLFLDEFAEFRTEAVNALRQPMESGEVVIARAQKHVTFWASFQLVAATNPCPCGNRGHALRACSCSPASRHRYDQRLTGPIFDRIDVSVIVASRHSPGGHEETSAAIAQRVIAARAFGRSRGQKAMNRQLAGRDLRRGATNEARLLLDAHAERHLLSGRGTDSALRVARSIADLREQAVIDEECIAEALSYRRFSSFGTTGDVNVRREDASPEASH